MILFIFALCSFRSLGQEQRVILNFYVEDRIVLLNSDFSVDFIIGSDTIKSRTENNSFYIPLCSKWDNRVRFVFKHKKFNLTFDSVKVNQNRPNQVWDIKIDKRPFDKEVYWYLKKLPKRIKWLYTLNLGNGSIITEYRFTRYPH